MDAAPISRAARDVLVVDLHGLKGLLIERARARGVSLSDFVRALLSEALGAEGRTPRPNAGPWTPPSRRDRVRVSLTLTKEEASALSAASRQAQLPLGAFVSELAANAPVLALATRRPDRLAALIASCATISTLSRNLHHLAQLLRQGSVQAARSYYEMLTTLNADVRGHLDLAAEVLAVLRPGRPPSPRPKGDPTRT